MPGQVPLSVSIAQYPPLAIMSALECVPSVPVYHARNTRMNLIEQAIKRRPRRQDYPGRTRHRERRRCQLLLPEKVAR
jgi:hypothetical protein